MWWVIAAYAVAIAAGGVTLTLLPETVTPLWAALIADIVATVVIFAFSRGLRCSSMYDAYWSVIPPLIVLFWIMRADGGANAIRAGAVLFFTTWWALRLTWNWARSWPGLHHEDWRYVELREKMGKFESIVDFLGIHFFPTIQVFLGLTGAWVAVSVGERPLNWLDGVAFVVTGGAIIIETVADQQLVAFAKTKQAGEILKTGLWAYSRHPNYFGEISFWWGLFLFGLAAAPGYWWTIAGPIAMTAMFMGVSIPWMDRRSCERRPAYAEHMKRVSGVVPWFPKKA